MLSTVAGAIVKAIGISGIIVVALFGPGVLLIGFVMQLIWIAQAIVGFAAGGITYWLTSRWSKSGEGSCGLSIAGFFAGGALAFVAIGNFGLREHLITAGALFLLLAVLIAAMKIRAELR